MRRDDLPAERPGDSPVEGTGPVATSDVRRNFLSKREVATRLARELPPDASKRRASPARWREDLEPRRRTSIAFSILMP